MSSAPSSRSGPRAEASGYQVASWGGQLGVYATRPIAAGHRILRFRGPFEVLNAIVDFTHHLEMARAQFLGPSGLADDYINHSCDPNCAVVIDHRIVRLVSVGAIATGEQLTFDYSTCMVTDPTVFTCHCGAAMCRGQVGSFVTLPLSLQGSYTAAGLVPEFVLAATASAELVQVTA